MVSLITSFSYPLDHVTPMTWNVLCNSSCLVVVLLIQTLLIACYCKSYSIKVTTSAAINLGKFTSEKFGSFGPYNKKTVHSDKWLVKLGSNILIPLGFNPLFRVQNTNHSWCASTSWIQFIVSWSWSCWLHCNLLFIFLTTYGYLFGDACGSPVDVW